MPEKKTYLNIASLVTPEALHRNMREACEEMSKSTNARNSYFQRMEEKYKAYMPVLIANSGTQHEFAGAFGILVVIFEVLDQRLNESKSDS